MQRIDFVSRRHQFVAKAIGPSLEFNGGITPGVLSTNVEERLSS